MARQPDPAVRSRWQSLIERHPRSGMTVAEFCEVHDVSVASFYQWRRKLAQETDAGPAFLSVRLTEHDTRSALLTRVHFDCGAVAEIPSDDQQSLAAIVDRLIAAGHARR